MRRIVLRQHWKSLAECIQSAARHVGSEFGCEIGFDQVHCPSARDVSKVKLQRMRLAGLISVVESPIARDDVKPPVSVQIACGYAVPPTRERCQSKLCRRLAQVAPLVFENPHRPPLASQHEFRVTVRVQITPDGAADQTGVFQHTGIF